MAAGIPARLTPAEGRKFGLQVGGAFLVLSAVMWWRDHETPRTVFATLGIVLVVAGIIIPGLLGPVYRGWMAFGLALSKITTPIFMSIVFYGVLTPIGLLRRAVGANKLIPQRAQQTYWHTRPQNERRGDLKHQF